MVGRRFWVDRDSGGVEEKETPLLWNPPNSFLIVSVRKTDGLTAVVVVVVV